MDTWRVDNLEELKKWLNKEFDKAFEDIPNIELEDLIDMVQIDFKSSTNSKTDKNYKVKGIDPNIQDFYYELEPGDDGRLNINIDFSKSEHNNKVFKVEQIIDVLTSLEKTMRSITDSSINEGKGFSTSVDIRGLANKIRLSLAYDEYVDTGELEQIESILKDYNYQPNSSATKFIKNISIAKSNTKSRKIPINKNVKVYETENLETGQTSYDYIANNEDYEITFKDLNALKSRQSISFRKTFDFILRKANEQNAPEDIYFNLEDYQQSTGYGSKDTAYRGAIRNFDILMGIMLGGTIKRGKKEIRNAASYIFTAREITYNQCFIECKPKIMKMLMQYFTILPNWAGELNTKAYDLLDYIFYMARQKQSIDNIRQNNKFNVSFKSINEYIGGHDPADTKRHAQHIINPMLNAIEEIETTQKGEKLFLTPIYNHNYKNVYEFLEDGYIEIELGKEATDYFCNRGAIRDKKIKTSIKRAVK